MTEEYRMDLVIRGGTVIDGTGGKGIRADVAIRDGIIVAVGEVAAQGREEVDATGLVVTPGFVDIHAHYDGQVTWDSSLQPSSQHGVTTVVIGNCGIGFAPCKAEGRDRLMRLMEGVEDLPEIVLTTALPWAWESFPDYLDFLGRRSFDVDVAAYLPHSALRVFVMGQRAVDREAATADDRARMAQLAREAMAAGAIGFATSRTINHRSSDGSQVPTLIATEQELTDIARAIGESGQGVLQAISDFDDLEAETAMLKRIAQASGRPLSVSLMQVHAVPDRWRALMDWIGRTADEGLPVTGQVAARPVGVLMGFDITYHPFMATPTFRQIAALPPEDRHRLLRDPKVRDAILSEAPHQDRETSDLVRGYDQTYVLGDPPNYEPTADHSIARIAQSRGVSADACVYDIMLEDDVRSLLLRPVVNYASGSLDEVFEMLSHKDTLYGLGDGGAHLGLMCDASMPTTLLAHWARDRTRGPRLTLESVVHGLSLATARAVGLNDRGMIAPGMKADLNIIDMDRLRMEKPVLTYDLPAGGRRLMQDAHGYVATIVGGVVTRRDGRGTGVLPGQLVRGAQAPGVV